MPTEDEYRYCSRIGMNQAECARHLGISQAAVTKAKRRLDLTFSRLGAFQSYGQERHQGLWCYPWDEFAIGDWTRTNAGANVLAFRASKAHAPKRFASVMRGGQSFIRRVA